MHRRALGQTVHAFMPGLRDTSLQGRLGGHGLPRHTPECQSLHLRIGIAGGPHRTCREVAIFCHKFIPRIFTLLPQISSIVLRGPQVGKFPAGLMPLIGPSLRRSPATFQTLGHGDLSSACSLLIAMSPLRSIAVMHPWVAAAWCRLYRTDASSASVQRVRADFAAAFVTVRAEERAAGTRLRRRGVMGGFGIVLPAMQT